MEKRALCLFVLALLAGAAPAAAEPGFPLGWSGSSAWTKEYEYGTAPVEGANGKAAYIRAKPDASRNGYFPIAQCIGAGDYAGKRLRLSARLKTVGAGAGQLWLRAYRGAYILGTSNMFSQRIMGTTGWQQRDITLNVPANSNRICFGFLLAGGQGEVWADDLSLAMVGAAAPVIGLHG